MPAIFISHSSQDNARAAEIKTWLATLGFEQTFLDFDKANGIGAGKNWERDLYEAIERCQAVIVVATPAWLASKWCFAEFANARSQGKPVFPIVFTPDDVGFVGPELHSIQAELWNGDGQKHLGERLFEIADEIARGYRFDGSRPPWPGILSYEAEDAAIFFGRDPEIRRLAEVLDSRRVQGGARLVLIVGASGSGKSSLLRAGLLPHISRDRRHWLGLPPIRPGTAPVSGFAKMLAQAVGRPADWQALRDRLASDPRAALAAVIEEARVGVAREATVLVAVDQFEELAALADASERAAMVRVLAALTDRARPLPALVVGTVRSDLLGELLKIEGFAASPETFALGPLPQDRLPAVIEGPARVAGIHLEPGLTRRILADVGTPEALPLLAFALRELHERYGAAKRLHIVEYEALGDTAAGLSPLANAVRRKAEDAFAAAAPSSAETRSLREAFLGSLTRLSDEGARLKRPARLADLPQEALPLIGRLTDARLLTLSGEGEERVVEVTHDALFTAWPQLKTWLDDEQDFLHARRQIEEARRMWQAAPANEKPKALLSGLLLARARDWQRQTPGRLAPMADFVAASISRRTTVRRRQVIAGLAAAAGVGVAGTVGARTLGELAAYHQAREEERNRTDLTGDVIIFSTSPGGYALDGEGRNSPFTGALLGKLSDPSYSVTKALMASVEETLGASDGVQRPEFVTNLNGEIYLSDPPPDRSTATLSVGVGNYQGSYSIPNPANDAKDMATLFDRFGYATEAVLDCTRNELLSRLARAVEPFVAKLTSRQQSQVDPLHVGLNVLPGVGEPDATTAGDMPAASESSQPYPLDAPLTNFGAAPAEEPRNSVFVFYFSGMGFSVNGETYLAAADTYVSDPADLDFLQKAVRVGDVLEMLRRVVAVRILILDTARVSTPDEIQAPGGELPQGTR